MVLYAGKQVEYLSSSTAVCNKNSGFIIIYLSAHVSHGLQFAPGVRYFITKYYRKYEITTVEPLAKETRVYTRETRSELYSWSTLVIGLAIAKLRVINTCRQAFFDYNFFLCECFHANYYY